MATDFWNGSGNWSTDDAAWSDNSPPISTEDAEIQTGTDNVTSAAAIANLQVDASAILDLTAGATLSATGSAAVTGALELSGGGSASINGGLSITGNGEVWVDSPFNSGGGGSSLTVGGTLSNSSSNVNGFYIGNANIGTGDTMTAAGLVNTGEIQIVGNGTIQSTLDITSGAAGFGTLGVETGAVVLVTDAMLEFASGQIGTIVGALDLDGANARVADAGTLATNSALTGLGMVTGSFQLAGGASVTTTGSLSITGNGEVWVDSPFYNGGGGSSLNVGGTLTNSSSNVNGLYIGNAGIGTGDTVTAAGLVNTGEIQIVGNGTIQSTLDITSGAAGFGTLGVETGAVVLVSDALLEFASGQIGTIVGALDLDGANARVADAGTLATTSALTGLTSVPGAFLLAGGASVTTTAGLSVTGNGEVWVDSPFYNGGGGSSLNVGGTLTNSSSNANALYIGNASIGTGDTVTATGLVNTGAIQIVGNGTIQSTLDITTAAAGFGTVGIETGSISLTNDALLEFASGQIGTIDGALGLVGPNARVADAGTLASNSALSGLHTVAGDLQMAGGASVTTSGALTITGNGEVWVDSPFNNAGGGSNLNVGGALTNSSTNGNALYIGNDNIGTGDTVTATGLVNSGEIQIVGNGTIQSTLDITTGAAGFGTVGIETGSVGLTNNALLEFASGQIATIDGVLAFDGSNARVADAGTLATNSALTGLHTVAGDFLLAGGASATTSGALTITGNGELWLDSPFNNGGGGSSLSVGGTLTNNSTNGNALYIGASNIGAGDTVTATALSNTGVIQIAGNGTIQSTLDITTGAAGFGTVAVETGSVGLTNNAMLEFASGQIGTIDGALGLVGANARVADAGTLATNSALTGLHTVAGALQLAGGASVTTSGALTITGNGELWLDSPFNNGGGGSSLTVGGTLTVSSTNGNALYIGASNIGAGDTLTAAGLNNTGVIQIVGNGTIVSALDINGSATNSAAINIDASGELQMGAGDIYTQAADATNIAAGGILAGTVDVTGGAVNIASGGLLAGIANVLGGSLDGTGTVVGTVNDTGGTVFAGPSIGTPGTLTVSGTYNQSGTGNLEANIGSGGTVSGVVAVTGGFVNLIGGTLSVSSTPAIGSLLTVMTFGDGDLVGQFAAVQDSAAVGDGSNVNLGDGTTLEVFYNSDAGNIEIERVNNASLASNYTWTAATGDWSAASDWNGGQTPNPTANVVIGSTGTGNVTLDGASGDTTVNSLSILTSNALTVSGVTLTSATGGGGISVAAGASLSLSNGEIDGSVLSGAGLLQSTSGVSVLAADTISAGTSFIGQNNTQTELLGPIDNAGTLEQFGGNGQNGALDIADAATLTGGGTVTLSTNPANGGDAIIQGNGQTLTNTNNTIQGTGFIGNGSLALVNAGVIDATTAGGSSTLTLNGSGIINTGTLAAAAGAALVINTPTVDNAGGTILDSAATSTVELVNATVQGGTLNDTAKGTMETVSSAELDGSTNGALTITASSSYTASDNTTTYLLGSIVNDAQILLNGGNGLNGILDILAPVTLTGGGTITLDTVLANGGEAIIQQSGQTLTNVNNTILGSGLIGNSTLVLINEHVIDATPEGGSSTLTLNGTSVTNTLTMEATAGGVLAINTTVDNAGGHITASGASSTVQLINATVQGGTLTTAGGGTMETVSSAELDGTTHGALTISTGSTYTASNNATTYLLGSIVNEGLIQLNGGNGQNGILDIDTSVTLSGGGTLTLSDNPANGANAYVQNNGVTLTNTNNTIQGTGIIGNSSLLLINGGVVDATPEAGSKTLTLNGGGVTNTDLLEATAGGTLAIQTNVTNTAANMTATGNLSTVTVSNSATITGGTLAAVNGGVIESTGNATLQGVTITALTTYISNNNLTTTLLDTIDNLGTIEQFGGNGQNGFLAIGNAVTLTGSGAVILDTTFANGGSAYVIGNGQTLTNLNNTILGTGVIGNGNLVLINSGVIDATPEPGGATSLTLNGGGITNTSTMEASGGGVLVINTQVDNAGANITTSDATSTVQVNAATIEGGTLNNTAGGTFDTVSDSTLDGSSQGALTISSGSNLTAANNTTTTLLGTISNKGLLEQFGGNGQNGFLAIGNAVTLTGSGTVILDTTLVNGASAYIIGNNQTLTNSNNTILGTGVIGNGNLVLINNGVIDATPEPGGATSLTLNGGGITNNSTMEASGGGVLVINTTVDNASANITTADATSTVQINAATIEGGTLNNAAGGTFDTVSDSTLDGSSQGVLTISSGSTVIATDNTTTTLLGTINNQGLLDLIGGNSQDGVLGIGGAVTLTGGGTLTLDDIAANGGNAFILGNSETLTNTNNTIQGTGIIGSGNLALINDGLVDATPEGGSATLTLNGGGVTNTSTMEASGGGVLLINTTVDNAGGNITTADAASTVEVYGASVEGGTLNNTAGGTFETVNDSTLDGSTHGTLTISTGSSVTAADNTTTTLLGTINNKGSLEQIGGNSQNGFLDIGGAVTLTGGGTVTLDQISANGGAALIQGNGETLTNTNNTIQGTGIIGNGSLAMTNGGVIDATPEGGSSTLTLNGTGTFTSTGTLEATGGATLALDLGPLTVSGLVSVAANSALDLTGELTVNGTLANLGAVSGGGATEVAFGSGTDRLILGPSATFGGTVVGGGTHTTLELAAGTGAGTLNALGTNFTNFGTVTVDAGATWTVDAPTSLLPSTTFIGDGALSTLVLTGAGTFSLAGVSNFGTIDLPAGNNTVTVTDKTLSGGAVTIVDGASGNNSVSAAGDTSASKGKTLTYDTGAGTDSFTGGFENDTVAVSIAALGGDTLTGGSGANTLVLTSAGVLNLSSNVSKFQTIDLAAGNSTVTVTDAMLSAGSLTINDGASGNNTVSATGDTSASKGKTLNYFTGPGTDSFTGGFENDAVHVSAAAVGGDVLTGGSGANTLTLSSAGAVNLSGVSKFGTIFLAAGNNTVTVTDTTLSGGTVVLNDGTSGNDTVSAAGDTSASKGKILNYFTGTGTDNFTGGSENDTIHVSAALVGGDVLTAGSGVNTLYVTSAGTANLAGVSKFGTIFLAAGNNTVTMTDTTLSGGTVVLNDGASGNDTVNAASDTSASKGKTLNYFTGTGTDSFTGGFESDVVHVSASAVGGDVLTGGSGTNTLILTSAGTVNLAGVSKLGTIDLAAGNNTVTVTDTTLAGGSVTINDGASGNDTISAAGDTSASKGKVLTYITGTGTDSFTGGFETDAVHVSAAAVGGDVLTGGGSGVNTLTLTTAGSANLAGVSKFQTIDLAAGNSTVTVTDTTLSGGAVTMTDGASGNNTVSTTGDTSASTGKTLTYNAGKGTDSFTGNFENDTVNVSAAAVSGDVLTGGSGVNVLGLTSAGSDDLGGVSKFGTIDLAAGNNTVAVTDTTLSGGTVKLNDGTSGNNTVSLAGDTSASTGKILNYFTGPGTDRFTGGFENDTVHVSAAAVGSDVLAAGSGANTLILTSAGTVNLSGVSKFGTIFLAAGNNTVTMTDTTLSGGTVILNDGTSGNNTVSAAGDTSASTGKTLNYFTGSGTDRLTGGFETDVVHVSAAAVGGDALTGGSTANTLILTSAGTANLGGVSKFGTIDLAAGNNTVTMTDTTLSGGTVVLNDGASGNDTVNAASDTSASKGKTLNYFTGAGTDSFTGGFESDVVHVSASAVGGDVLTGGSGTNTLILTNAGTVNLARVSKLGTIDLAVGNNTVTVTDTTLSGGAVTINDGASGNNTVSAASDTSASKGKTLTYDTGTGTDGFTGGFENDTVAVSIAALGSDTLTGGSGANTLVLTSAGVLNLGSATKFQTIDLAAGNNTVTVTDKTLSGGAVTIVDGASGNNSVSAAGDTSASKGKTLTYDTGAGTDSFTGGFENDTVAVSIAALGGDTLTGGSGANTLVLTSAGVLNLSSNVSKFQTIDLAAGNSTVTVTDAMLSAGSLTINDGASGNNTVSATGDTSASKGKTLNYFTGLGTDSFTGGFENDAVHVSAAAVGGDVLTGGSGANTLTLSSAGAVNLSGVSKFGTIFLAAGNNTVTMTDTTLSGGTVVLNDGTSGNDTVSAAGDTSASKGKILNYFTGTGTDNFTGGSENDTIHVSAALVGGDVLTAGSGVNTLYVTSAGTANLAGVSKFGTIFLAAGNNTVTMTDTTLSGGTVVLNDGASGNDTVNAASDTSASKGKTLNYFTGTGTDSFTGGFESDVVHVSASAVGGDVLTGGSGTNTLILTSAGTVNLAGVSKLGTIDLAAGNNTVTVTDTTLAGGSVTINDGASGNDTISAAGDTSASKGKVLTYITGTGTDSFTGGFETDAVHVSAAAVGGDVLTGGGSGVNTLTLTTAGSANLAGVSKFQTIDLAAGNSTVTVTDTTLSGGAVTMTDGASGNNTVSTTGDTSASIGKTLTYNAGKGTDSFTGNFENDTVNVSAAAVSGDVLTGGSGVNVLGLTSAGSDDLGGVSKFGTIDLAAGNNTVAVTDTTLSGGTVKLNDGTSGNNTVSLAGDTSASTGKILNYFTGPGTDRFTGGFENDTVHVSAAAVGSDVLAAGSGANTLILTSAGTVNLSGVSKFGTIFLAAGNNTVTMTDTTLSGGTVILNDGTSGNDTVSAAGDTSASKGKILNYFTGTGTDNFTGGSENDTIHVSAALVGGDVLTAGSGVNTLYVTSAGTANLAGVSKFGTIFLAAGNNTVTMTDTTLSGGTVVLNDGASGNDTVNAASDTSASKGKTLNYFTGTGTDSFTGGFESDVVHVSASAVGGDVLTGGSGTNTLILTNAGTVNLAGVSKLGTIDLAVGNNTVTVTDTTLSGGAVTINAGSTGNDTISAAGDTAASKGTSLTYDAGSGTNGFTGGFENDTIYAGTGSGSFTASSGSDTFVFIKSNLPDQTLNNFQVSADDILVYGTHASGGFDLGSTDNPLNPTTPTAIDPSIFIANASGDFISSAQRFAYDTTNGQLFYSATGSNASESLIASLTGAPDITAGNLLFER